MLNTRGRLTPAVAGRLSLGRFGSGLQKPAEPNGPAGLIAIAKSFSRYGTCSKGPNPPYPPFFKGGNLADFL